MKDSNFASNTKNVNFYLTRPLVRPSFSKPSMVPQRGHELSVEEADAVKSSDAAAIDLCKMASSNAEKNTKS